MSVPRGCGGASLCVWLPAFRRSGDVVVSPSKVLRSR